jgi:hypothetical protein
LVAIATLFAFASVAVQPISSDLAWWQLSCGRQAIVAGSLWPSADLLIDESQGESTTVGATVSTAIYLLFGASGWMLVRVAVVVAAAALTVFYSRRRNGDEPTANRNWSIQLAWLTISLAALSPYLDPVPILFDVIATALVAVWILLPDDGRQFCNRIDFLSLSILFLFWANFGNHSFVGITMIVVAGLSAVREIRTLISRAAFQRFAIGTAIALFAAMINPTGWRVWVDSFSQTVPWMVAPPWTLAGTDWAAFTQVPWGLSHWVFLLLTLATVVSSLAVSQRHDHLAITIALQFFAWTSAVNMPLAIIWMTVQLLASAGHWPLWRSTSPSLSHSFVSIAVMVVVSAIMVRTVGWGFEADLDPRMLENAIADSPDTGTILTDDPRSTGMVAWVLGPVKKAGSDGAAASRLHDEPGRALVGGRLIEHRRLFADLRDSQQMSYWRDDESQGGWWLPLSQRGTSLLACSRRDLKLIRRLEPTIWKPLSLDSPVLIYARAGDPIHTPQIVELLGQRDFINSGMWDYQPPQSTGSAYDRDRFGLFPARAQPDQTFDQADVFAAMDLQIAALEVLDFTRQRWPRHARFLPAWQRCQIELADWERTSVGQASLMRTLASGKFSDADDLMKNFRLTQTEFGNWERLIAVYRTAGAGVALQACEAVTDGTAPNGWEAIDQSTREQLRYAAVCWAIESGRRDDAMRWVAALKVDPRVSMVMRLLAQHQWVAQGWIDEAQTNSQETVR